MSSVDRMNEREGVFRYNIEYGGALCTHARTHTHTCTLQLLLPVKINTLGAIYFVRPLLRPHPHRAKTGENNPILFYAVQEYCRNESLRNRIEL